MSKRNTDNAEVQRVVRWIKFITQEVDLIKMTKTWSEEDFLYAIERVQTDLPEIQQERRDEIRGLYRTLLMECQAADARIAMEKANAQRHDALLHRLEELKKPHWSIVPNFWMTATILIFTIIGVIAALLALHL